MSLHAHVSICIPLCITVTHCANVCPCMTLYVTVSQRISLFVAIYCYSVSTYQVYFSLSHIMPMHLFFMLLYLIVSYCGIVCHPIALCNFLIISLTMLSVILLLHISGIVSLCISRYASVSLIVTLPFCDTVTMSLCRTVC